MLDATTEFAAAVAAPLRQPVHRVRLDWDQDGDSTDPGENVTAAVEWWKEGKKIRFWHDPLTWVRACLKYRFVRLGK